MLLIEWIDSKHGQCTWEYLENVPMRSASIITSVGFLIKEDKVSIMLGCSHNDLVTQVSHVLTVPKIAIRKRRRLK